MSAPRCNVADLLHPPAARRPVHFETDASELGGVGGARLDDQPLFLEAVLERVPDGVVVQGTVRGFYAAQCSRCLRPVHREVVTAIRELFEVEPIGGPRAGPRAVSTAIRELWGAEPIDGQTYPIEGEEIDLELPVRDALLLDL